MRRPVIVFVGGGLGACLRALLLAGLGSWGRPIPVPVLLANLLGAFALGIVYIFADEVGLLSAETRLFLAVGVLGGFTTFSTFGWGADLLLAHGAHSAALVYLAVSVIGGVCAVGLGLLTGRELVAALERAAVALLQRLDRGGSRGSHGAGHDMAAIETGDGEESA